MEFCGAIDVGGTKIASALFTRQGQVRAKDKALLDKSGGDAAAAQVGERIAILSDAARSSGGRLRAVGICVPGIAYSASGKVWAPNIPGWDQYPLLEKLISDSRLRKIPFLGFAQGIDSSPPDPRRREANSGERPGRSSAERLGAGLLRNIFKEHFSKILIRIAPSSARPRFCGSLRKLRSLPVPPPQRGSSSRHPSPPREGIPEKGASVKLVIESDRSAYVAGEAWKGAAAGARDAVFLAVGTGIGAGIISGGRILHGHEDIAGAVGWFGLDPDFKAEYAAMGSFEAEASGNSVARKARERLAKGSPSAMLELAGGDIEAVTAEVVAAAARRKDALAMEIVAGVVTYLAMGVANIVSLLNPEVVVVGGGLFRAADIFLEPVRREFRRWAQPLAARSVRIEPSALGEDAGLYGCGRLAWDGIENK
jgi:predicted NBD/HSP70 family sugar kinase